MATTITLTEDYVFSLPPSKVFQAFLDSGNLLPKIAPQSIKSIQTLQGSGGPGTIKQINFPHGSPFKYVKHRLDAIDKENLTLRYTAFEGDVLMDKIENISTVVKMDSVAGGKCQVTRKSTYAAKAGAEIKEEEIKKGKRLGKGIFDAVEAYLIANP